MIPSRRGTRHGGGYCYGKTPMETKRFSRASPNRRHLITPYRQRRKLKKTCRIKYWILQFISPGR